MKRFFVLLLSLFIYSIGFAQTTFNSTGSTSIATNYVNYYNDITVSGVGVITVGGTELSSVTINITHTYDSDLDIYLISPDATQIELSTDNGSSGNNYTNTVFLDDGTTSCVGQSAPFTGTYKPESGTMASLNNGQNADGTWRLRVYDDASGDVGTIDSWSIIFTPPPTCPIPTAISSSDITDVTTNINWTLGGSETKWDIEYGVMPYSFTGTPTVSNITGSPETLASLSPNTTYEYKVRADCGGGDESIWVGAYSFTTACGAMAATFLENLDVLSTPDLPQCWSEIGDVVTRSSTYYSSPNCAELYIAEYLISPELSDLTTGLNQIRFYARGWSSGVVLSVGTITDPADDATYTEVGSISLTSGYTEYIVPFYSTSDNYFVFKYSSGSSVMLIDDIVYEPQPTCPNPSDISASSITGSTANISWVQGGSPSEWDIEYGIKPHTFDESEDVNNTSDNPHQLTDLSSLTTYEYRVRADCGSGDKSEWSQIHEFTTTCATLTPVILPFTEDFEATGNTQFDDGYFHCATNHMWYLDTDNANGRVKYGSDAIIANEGSGALTMDASISTWVTNYAIMTVDLSSYSVASDLYLSFDYTDHSDADDTDDKVWIRGSDSDAWTEIYDFNHSSVTNGIYNSVIDLDIITTLGTQTPSSTFQIKFGWRGYGSASSSTCCEGVTFDNISIYTCPKPSDLTATNITGSTADLSWSANGSSTWDIEIGTVGFSPTGTPTHIGVWNSYTMSDLLPETSYDYYLRADCGGSDYSQWVGPYNFITTVSCPEPSVGTVTNITTTTADLGWINGGIETIWDIELGQDNFIPTGTPTQTGVISNPFHHTGLTPGTDYDFYVRSYCGVGDESTWEGPYSFTTNLLVGQVYVTASAGTTSGVYNTLKEAFDKINDGTHQGAIDIEIGASEGETITETAAASLNNNGVGAASYTSIVITPGAANIKLVSSIVGSCCVPTGTIALNGCENVVIDGRQNGIGENIDLTIENTATSTWGSAIAFIAASHDTVRYCTLKSGNTASSGYGTVSFCDNNVGGGAGASFNLLENCKITKSGTNIPRHAIGGDGASGRENYNNTIRGCDIYDFEEFGIFLGSSSSSEGYNRGWIIEGNDIYQTTAFANMFKPQIGICIGYPYSSGSSGNQENGTFTIRNNTIGGNGSGGYWQWSGGSYVVAGIYVYTTYDADSAYTTIDGNIITKFDITSTNGNLGSSSKSVFSGIISNNCRTYIGNMSRNIIGNPSEDDAIKFESTNGSGNIYAISMTSGSSQDNRIVNNIISGFSITEGAGGMVFKGIFNNCATTNTSDSISQNNVSYISTSKCNYFTGIDANGFICKNRIRDINFTGTSASSELIGISWHGGDVVGRGVENNEIILGHDKNGTSVASNSNIIGIKLGRNSLVYYNSVLIEGSASSNNTIGIYVDWASGTIFENNLVYIERDGGTGKHYAIYNDVYGIAGWTSSNNAYVINCGAKSTSYIGYWDFTSEEITDLAIWQTKSGESNSIFDTPTNQPKNTLFPFLVTQDNLDVDDPSWLEAGTPATETIDIRNHLRDPVVPTIGAYEKAELVLPVEIISFSADCIKEGVDLIWQTASEINSDYFVVEKSKDAMSWIEIDQILTAGNSNEILDYKFMDSSNKEVIEFYRLKMVDMDGSHKYSDVISVDCKNEIKSKIVAYPNPVDNELIISVMSRDAGEYAVMINNSCGQMLYTKEVSVNQVTDEIRVNTECFPEGIYLLNIIDIKTGEMWMHKIIKKKH